MLTYQDAFCFPLLWLLHRYSTTGTSLSTDIIETIQAFTHVTNDSNTKVMFTSHQPNRRLYKYMYYENCYDEVKII